MPLHCIDRDQQPHEPIRVRGRQGEDQAEVQEEVEGDEAERQLRNGIRIRRRRHQPQQRRLGRPLPERVAPLQPKRGQPHRQPVRHSERKRRASLRPRNQEVQRDRGPQANGGGEDNNQ